MGRNDKKKRNGMEKTIAKTERNLSKKLKSKSNEEDILITVKRMKEQSLNQPVMTHKDCPEPSTRLNATLCSHPYNNELYLFGGEYFDGKHTSVFGDLYVYKARTSKWNRLERCPSPAPRCGHAAAVVAAGASGQMWLFGGEYCSTSGDQFCHYGDLWCLDLKSTTWEHVKCANCPSARSGHRMAHVSRHLVVFGGFHSSQAATSASSLVYYNDVHVFSLDSRVWLRVSVTSSTPAALPTPRSAVCLLPVAAEARTRDQSARAHSVCVVYGGYSCDTHAVSHTDMYRLSLDIGATSSDGQIKVKWEGPVKQRGMCPSTRTNVGCCVISHNRALIFGGVSDQSDQDGEGFEGTFYSSLYVLDLHSAVWRHVTVGSDVQPSRGSSHTVCATEQEVGAVASALQQSKCLSSTHEAVSVQSNPSPRSKSLLVARQNTVYLYGGYVEKGHKELMLADMYSIDVSKFDEWKVIIAPAKEEVWLESDCEMSSQSDDGSSEMSSDESDV